MCVNRTVRGVRFLALVGVVSFPVAQSHGQEKRNPLAGDPAAIKEGASLFRTDCSPCHGLNARGGGRGPDLTSGQWLHGASDAAIFQTISQGVPGTEMPANPFEDSETWTLVAYLRSISSATHAPVAGDRAKGEHIFFTKGQCAQCHMVRGGGGRLGPDLTRVGAARSVAYLTESIREPDRELSLGMTDPNNHYVIPMEYETVTVTTSDGRRIIGVAKNEDAFSIQLLGQDDELHLFLKKNLSDLVHERRSLMPAYTEQMMSAGELQDLLAYLTNLGGE